MIFKYLILVTLAVSFFRLTAQELDDDPIIFTVNTLRLNIEDHSTTPLPNTILTGIKAIGRGKDDDLECDGISDENGEIVCIVKRCNKNSPLSSSYHISVAPPNIFGEMTPAKITISNCNVIPKPVSTIFAEWTLVAQKYDLDTHYVFGDETENVLNGNVSPTANVAIFANNLDSLIGKPAGTSSAIKMRKLFQDYSLLGVREEAPLKAIFFSDLIIAHGNTWLNRWATENGVEGLTRIEVDDTKTMKTNLDIILSYSDNTAVEAYRDRLQFLRVSLDKGVLGNEQFTALESLTINVF